MEKFREHVFISYAHLDNTPRYQDPDGWVTRFEKELEKVLSMRLGRRARIWRDDRRMAGNSVLDKEIEDGVTSSALLVTVLSPSYLGSKYCRDELDLFCNHAESSIGLRLKNGRKIRIFKVVKLPVRDRNSLPPPLPESLEFSFYSENTDMELDPGINMSDIPDYNKKIVGIAKHASDAIQELEQQCDSQSDVSITRSEYCGPGQATSVKIFLAECSSDMRDPRENLRTELIAFNGYTVFPEHLLPLDSEAEHRENVSSLLQECNLSVHIIGDRYGTIPDGPSEKSTVELQNEIAAEAATRSAGLKRLIWLPRTTQPKNPRQQAFIEQLQREPSLQAGADLLIGDFEEFRTAVHQLLKAQAQEKEQADLQAERSAGQEDSDRYVYMICTQEDLTGIRRLRKTLKERGYRVERPPLEGTETPEELRKHHLEHLRGCAGLLLFYGAGGDRWYQENRSELRKLNAYRDGVAGGRIPRYTYLAEPDNALKEDVVDDEGPCLIDGRRGFDPSLLDPFLEAMARERNPA